jgi:hypothetical protein
MTNKIIALHNLFDGQGRFIVFLSKRMEVYTQVNNAK